MAKLPFCHEWLFLKTKMITTAMGPEADRTLSVRLRNKLPFCVRPHGRDVEYFRLR